MHNFTSRCRIGRSTFKFVLFSFLLLLTVGVQAQRGYNLIYSENLKGNTTMFGNTLLHIKNGTGIDETKMNGNSANGNSTYGNDNENMIYVDIDGTTGNGSVTRNSSSADLILPTGANNIKFARLYWGGRIKNSDFNLDLAANRTVKIRKGSTNAFTDVNALGIDKSTIESGYTQYQGYADITAFVKQNGGGTYTVGNVPLSTGSVSGGGNHGGWTIVVVYENLNTNYNSVRVYDGFQKVYNGGTSTTTAVTLTGLDVPSGTMATADARMGVMAWEGDANISGDFLKINGNLFQNATNQKNNPWNGTITNNGVHVTTKNPNYTNTMGVDIDMFDVGTGFGIQPNDKSVNLLFGTEADQYYPGLFTFAIRMKDPSITLEKTVKDANGNFQAEPGEVLTYTLKGQNIGIGNANYIELIDTLPGTVTYVPNSLEVIAAPGVSSGIKTDNYGDDIADYISNGNTKTIKFRVGAGSNATTGGSLAEAESYEVRFKVTVNAPARGQIMPSILNIARISSKSDANVNFTDDGTAIINPEAGPLPVSLTKFTALAAGGNKIQLDWATATEINNDYFIVEKSSNGFSFSEVVKLKGAGTTTKVQTYTVMDDVANDGPVVYYRLKQVDFDGKINLSKVVVVKMEGENSVNSVSPNPFSSYLNMTVTWSSSEVITARIINIQGKEMASKKIQVSKGTNTIHLDDLGKLPGGNYFIQLISPTQRLTQKVAK